MTKTLIILICFFWLALVCCTGNSNDIPNNGPLRSSTLTYFIGELKSDDNISFPEQYEIIEEDDSLDGKARLYNACIKLSHKEIQKFIKENKLFPPDTLKYGVYSQSSFMFIKGPNFSTSFYLNTENKVELYADTTLDKLYISKYY